MLPAEPVILLVSRDLPVGALPQEEATPQLNCEAALTAEPTAAAMVNLTLTAPVLRGALDTHVLIMGEDKKTAIEKAACAALKNDAGH